MDTLRQCTGSQRDCGCWIIFFPQDFKTAIRSRYRDDSKMQSSFLWALARVTLKTAIILMWSCDAPQGCWSSRPGWERNENNKFWTVYLWTCPCVAMELCQSWPPTAHTYFFPKITVIVSRTSVVIDKHINGQLWSWLFLQSTQTILKYACRCLVL